MVFDSNKQYLDFCIRPFVIDKDNTFGHLSMAGFGAKEPSQIMLNAPVFSIEKNIVNAISQTMYLPTNVLPYDNLIILPEELLITEFDRTIQIKSIFLIRCACKVNSLTDTRETIMAQNRNDFDSIFKVIKKKDAAYFDTIMCYVVGNNINSLTDGFIAVFYFDSTNENKEAQKSDEKVKQLVSGFVNFLNNPEVSFIEHNPAIKKNNKRIERGKFPLPTRFSIRVNGKLKVYLENYERESKNNPFSHSFWVRGHFRHLTSDSWKNKKGQTIWIVPYVKGKGILVNKDYNLARGDING